MKLDRLLYKLLSFFTLFCIQFSGNSQSCLPNGITIERQGQIDSFSIYYPSCRKIDGSLNVAGLNITNVRGLSNIQYIKNLWIEATKITDLKGLESLKIIDGKFTLRSNFFLTSLQGLDSLVTVNGDLIIGHNYYGLLKIEEINALKTINGNLVISDNNYLDKINGFNSLSEITSGIIFELNPRLKSLPNLNKITKTKILSIRYNDSIVDFFGLNKLSIVDSNMTIQKNDRLVDLNGLNSIKTVNGNISLKENASLLTLNGLENLRKINGNLNIEKNNLFKSISDLGNLDTVSGIITIWENNNLNNLFGLSNLSNAGGISIFSNKALENLGTWKTLKELGYSGLSINFCPKLKNLTGFNKLTKIGSLYLANNDSLKDLAGLETVNLIDGSIIIVRNKQLDNIDGLRFVLPDSLQNIEIKYCDNLKICHIGVICSHLFNPNSKSVIEHNATGCSTRTEVINKCFPTGIDNIDSKIINVFPNPTDGILFINGEVHENSTAVFADITGKVIKSTPVKAGMIDLKELKGGIYCLTLKSSTTIFSTRIIKF